MKDLGRTRFCLGLQIEHLKDGIFMHQSTSISKILKRFYMDKAHPLSTPMVVRSLETIKDPFSPKGNDEELLGPEVPYLSVIGALMYLASHTRPDISFTVNLLARYSLPLQEDIGQGLNRYFDILEAQWIWVYIILFRPSLDW